MFPWRDWYHCTAHTYGTWLRGDPRGWRSRHHREHVDGDYRNPPPKGKYDALHEYSKSLMKRDPVEIDERSIVDFVLRSILDRFDQFQIPCPVASFDGVHAHALIQCPKHNPRIAFGIAKQYATAQLKAHGLAVGLQRKAGEGIWSKGSHPTPIADAEHFENTLGYIRDHEKKGAVVIARPEQIKAHG